MGEKTDWGFVDRALKGEGKPKGEKTDWSRAGRKSESGLTAEELRERSEKMTEMLGLFNDINHELSRVPESEKTAKITEAVVGLEQILENLRR